MKIYEVWWENEEGDNSMKRLKQFSTRAKALKYKREQRREDPNKNTTYTLYVREIE